jgi:oligo-1,6-glucosidase
MINVPKSWTIEEFKDIETLGFYNSVASASYKNEAERQEALDRVMRDVRILGRDNARLPMQWDASPFAGFTSAENGGWMRVHDLYPEINVEKQIQEGAGSVLGFWKSMIKLRKEHPYLFTYGSFELFDPANEDTFVFGKRHGDSRAVVALNFSSHDQLVRLPFDDLTLRVGNYDDVDVVEKISHTQERLLRPWEGRLYLSNDK